MPSGPGVFQFGTFLSVALSDSTCIFALVPSTSPCSSFSILFIHPVFSVMISLLPYFASK